MLNPWCSMAQNPENQGLTHGVAGFVQVDDGGLIPDHHGQRVDDALAANAAVPEALEGEVVGASGGGCIHLDCTCLHGITDADGCVHVSGEQATLQSRRASGWLSS